MTEGGQTKSVVEHAAAGWFEGLRGPNNIT